MTLPGNPAQAGGWLVLCSCGWQTRVSSDWAAQSAAKLHEKLGSKRTEHVVRIEASG